VGKIKNVINSILLSVVVTLCWRLLAERRGAVSNIFEREIKKI
jgi:hypothetical protein